MTDNADCGRTRRLLRWTSEWIETLRVAPPFSRRRRELLARLADMDDPSQWVEVERPRDTPPGDS